MKRSRKSLLTSFVNNFFFPCKHFDISRGQVVVNAPFTPTNIAALAHRLQIPCSLMFMSCPGRDFPYVVSDFGTRIVSLWNAPRPSLRPSISSLHSLYHHHRITRFASSFTTSLHYTYLSSLSTFLLRPFPFMCITSNSFVSITSVHTSSHLLLLSPQ